jgi:tellurite resistance protein TehA-like permease
MPDDDDLRKTRFLPILGYVFGAFALMALLAFAIVTILRILR